MQCEFHQTETRVWHDQCRINATSICPSTAVFSRRHVIGVTVEELKHCTTLISRIWHSTFWFYATPVEEVLWCALHVSLPPRFGWKFKRWSLWCHQFMRDCGWGVYTGGTEGCRVTAGCQMLMEGQAELDEIRAEVTRCKSLNNSSSSHLTYIPSHCALDAWTRTLIAALFLFVDLSETSFGITLFKAMTSTVLL